MSDAVLERIKDELELDEALTGDQVVAAARISLHLPETEDDLATQVREICEELGIVSQEGTHQLRQRKPLTVEEGVPPAAAPPCGRVTADPRHADDAAGMTARTIVTAAPGTASPPSYEDALELLEDPRQLHAHATARPDRLPVTPAVPWAQQLLAQLSLRNEFQGDRLHSAFIGLVRLLRVDGPAVLQASRHLNALEQAHLALLAA